MSERRLDFTTEVACVDGDLGQVTKVILGPETLAVTDVVVVPNDVAARPRIVPLAHLTGPDDGTLRLDCTTAGLARFREAVEYTPPPPITATQVIVGEFAGGRFGAPYLANVGVEEAVVPAGEVALQRSFVVDASDGRVGDLDGVILDDGGRLSAFVVREGHLLHHHQFALPVDLLGQFGENSVELAATRDELAVHARPC